MKTQVLTAPGTWTGSVLICDDRALVAQALGAQLATAGAPVEVSGVVHDGPALLAALERTTSSAGRGDGPELLFIGVHRGSSAGLDAVRLVRSRYSAVPVLAFGATADADALAAAVAAGASGALLWDLSWRPPGDATTARFVRATRWHSAGIPRQPLTERERQILQAISNGRSNGEIGRELLLSQDSIKNTAHRMFAKLGARDRANAVAIALRDGLLS